MTFAHSEPSLCPEKWWVRVPLRSLQLSTKDRQGSHRMKNISPGYLLPSAALTIGSKQLSYYSMKDKPPEIGDVVYGKVLKLGQHQELENKEGRIHKLTDDNTASGTKCVFVFGNRYAPDYYEGLIPKEMPTTADLLCRSGVIGLVSEKNCVVKEPTKIRVLGYACNKDGDVVNTRNYSKIKPKSLEKKPNRAKLILVVGTAMNSGKSAAAAACCWGLRTAGHDVRASKITGTASLKDILYMSDVGANPVNDFSYFGWPSTYMLDEADLLDIFNKIDLKIANNSKNYWVVEIADGVLQRETAMLLRSTDVRSRIHRLIFAAHDAFGAIGGLKILKDEFDLVPDAISGVCSSSPLALRELDAYTSIPVFNNLSWDLKNLTEVLL